MTQIRVLNKYLQIGMKLIISINLLNGGPSVPNVDTYNKYGRDLIIRKSFKTDLFACSFFTLVYYSDLQFFYFTNYVHPMLKRIV